MERTDSKLLLSPAPHISSGETIPRIMYTVLAAMAPAALASIYFFRFRAALLIVACSVTALVTEYVFQKIRRKPITIWDGSALVTGVLLAFNLPPSLPVWMAVAGTVFAIAIGKQIFGGLGHNPFNPALVGRVFLLAAFPMAMTAWTTPIDGLSTATPLAALKVDVAASSTVDSYSSGTMDAATSGTVDSYSSGTMDVATSGTVDSYSSGTMDVATSGTVDSYSSGTMDVATSGTVDGVSSGSAVTASSSTPIRDELSLWDMFIGRMPGSLGETSALAILLGGLFLIYKGYIDWRIPVGYLGTVIVFALVFGQDPLFHLLTGGLMLGAFFMATDMVTTPLTTKGRWIFAIGGGVILMVIRLWGGYPEGVSYSILLMNGFTPLINRFTRPKFFGEVKARA